MLTKKPQAVAGVSATYENVIEELYPSIASIWLGQLLNSLYESLPGYGQVRLSYLIFVPLTWPLGLLGYFAMKVFGSKYVVTNRAVKRYPVLGFQLLEEATLANIDRVTVDPDSKLAFFRTGDVRLSSADGGTLMLMRGIPYPERFCQVILEARDARKEVEASMNTIRNRK
ncbi:hypothetical protein GC163_01390 [bacterium]|nr:hypothetical protein [bacterium]